MELAARAEGARRGACLEHGAEGGGRGWEPGGGHATECGSCGPAAVGRACRTRQVRSRGGDTGRAGA